MKFFTGGKSIPGFQRLFVFSGLFIEILDRVVPPGSQSLMPKRAMSGVGVQIGGLGALGSNGLLYVNLPDSTTVDITPQSDVPYYYFSVGGGEVKVRIYDVNTGAEWTDKTIDLVVGQKPAAGRRILILSQACREFRLAGLGPFGDGVLFVIGEDSLIQT